MVVPPSDAANKLQRERPCQASNQPEAQPRQLKHPGFSGGSTEPGAVHSRGNSLRRVPVGRASGIMSA